MVSKIDCWPEAGRGLKGGHMVQKLTADLRLEEVSRAGTWCQKLTADLRLE
jgi:hypothetical protein